MGRQNRRGQKRERGPVGRNSRQQRMLDMSEIADADVDAVMKIVSSCSVFKVNAATWPCNQAGGDPTDLEFTTCRANFDPQSGFSCDGRSRCFPTNLQVGMSETIKQRMDAVATKLFVRQNLMDEHRFSKFLHTFNAAATNVLKRLCTARSLVYGRDVFLAFKGGNVMRLVLTDVLSRLPPAIQGEWADLMQIGDMDFEVFINDATEQMVRDTTVLMLYVLYSFRGFMEKEGWVLHADAEAHSAMTTVVPATTALSAEGFQTHSDDNITVPYTLRDGCDLLFVPVKSVLMHQPNRDTRARWIESGVRSDTPLSISLNKSVSIGVVQKKGVAPEADIVLMRIKHGLRLTAGDRCYGKATGEVIDVSIPTNNDRMHRIKSQDKSIQWFSLYEFDLGGRRIQVHAPSIDNFVLDLHMFMFVLSEYPWFDPKQAKRMKRYIWFCTMSRSQKGASPSMIVEELASVARVLQTLLSKYSVRVSQSLARQTSPWAELVEQIQATHRKAEIAGIGFKEWADFVRDMRLTALSVRVSYSSLVGEKSSHLSSSTSRGHQGAVASQRASLAQTAVSASRKLSRAEIYRHSASLRVPRAPPVHPAETPLRPLRHS